MKRSHTLRAFCLWSAFVWIVLVKNMITDHDHSAGFRAVHIGLAIVSLALAGASWPLARRLDRGDQSSGS